MKLTGNRRKGRHVNKNAVPETNDILSLYGGEFTGDPPGRKQKKAKKKWSGKKKALTVIGIVFAVLIAAAAAVYFFVDTALNTRPSVREHRKGEGRLTPTDPANPLLPGTIIDNIVGGGNRDLERNPYQYTFLLLAADDGNGNTDVIMAVSLDTEKHTLEVVNIPRDTLTNVSWSNKKANQIYANMRQSNGWDDINAGMDATVGKFADILGFETDYWCLVDMRAFRELIAAIGGVDFNIPRSMNYDDNDAGLHIHFSPGMQHLDAQQALELVRFRSYGNADIGRIGMQQEFLMSAARQILDKKDSMNLRKLAEIALLYLKTNLTLSDLIWFGGEFMKLNADSIHFSLMPHSPYGENVTINVDEWLALVNEKLNPFTDDITPADVSILTRGPDGSLCVTDENWQGGFKSGANDYTPPENNWYDTTGYNEPPQANASYTPSDDIVEPTDEEPSSDPGDELGIESAEPADTDDGEEGDEEETEPSETEETPPAEENPVESPPEIADEEEL